jgi:Ca2+-binding RTX toxin-like protein
MATIILGRDSSNVLGQESFAPLIFVLTSGYTFTATKYFAVSESALITIEGTDLAYTSADVPSSGVISRISVESRGVSVDITGLSFSAARFNELVHLGNSGENVVRTFSELYAGDDLFRGSAKGDVIRSYAGADTVNAGSGDDRIIDPSGANYLRGDEGNDSISGGSDFDDINGNVGNDTASGGAGADWVVGGKDNDSLSGDAGDDLIYGNLGNDTCEGADGADIVRGGQGDDVVRGGAGADFVSGDLGADTMVGGAGADVFHTFGEAGLDSVFDFVLAEGDRVQLDPSTQYTVAQLGGDTVISMTGGGQMILVGVQMSALTPGWIFGA